jgi:ABC-type transport system involved in cytochrome bd biosynthesis fused ATPase/permease subunit
LARVKKVERKCHAILGERNGSLEVREGEDSVGFFPNPVDDFREFFLRGVLPYILFLLAFAVVFFGRVKIGLALIVAAILILIGVYLLGLFSIPGVG